MSNTGQNYNCGIGPAFAVIGGKWKASILWELREGVLRYGQLKRRIAGVTEKMLIQQLRELERDGLVERRMFPEVPPRVEYELTSWGVSLNDALGQVADWGETYAKTMGHYAERTNSAEPLQS
jgi:DNA-binding HxlR family transcriptional regulator